MVLDELAVKVRVAPPRRLGELVKLLFHDTASIGREKLRQVKSGPQQLSPGQVMPEHAAEVKTHRPVIITVAPCIERGAYLTSRIQDLRGAANSKEVDPAQRALRVAVGLGLSGV